MHTTTLPQGEPLITVTRTFDAPRALVWKAFVEPQHRVAWWGPHGYTNVATQYDVRPGGEWRIVTTLPGGHEIAFFGEFREIVRPEKLSHTFGMENMYDGATCLETHVFEERDGKTLYTGVSVFDTVEQRDGLAASGMEKGVKEGFERLDTILAELATVSAEPTDVSWP